MTNPPQLTAHEAQRAWALFQESNVKLVLLDWLSRQIEDLRDKLETSTGAAEIERIQSDIRSHRGLMKAVQTQKLPTPASYYAR